MVPVSAAMDNSLTVLLGNLTSSLESAASTLPNETSILPPKDGISLFDVKNELLLSYLQNLVFLILIKLRNGSRVSRGGESNDPEDLSSLQDEVVKKLVEVRVYLEKGVRPLEGRLKYQIDKVIRAADDLTRSTSKPTGTTQQSSRPKKSSADSESGDSDSDSQVSSPDDSTTAQIDDLSYRPNPSAFQRPSATTTTARTSSAAASDDIYRPPRITPMAPPETRPREDRAERRPGRSATMDEYVQDEEFSTAPIAQPSLGSNIRALGRSVKTSRERREDEERREYEESNFVRLPKESKKERARKGGRSREAGYGGEDWRGLGAGLDRIERLTRGKRGGVAGALGSSRKRERAVEDGPRGDGGMGGEFAKRRKKALR